MHSLQSIGKRFLVKFGKKGIISPNVAYIIGHLPFIGRKWAKLIHKQKLYTNKMERYFNI